MSHQRRFNVTRRANVRCPAVIFVGWVTRFWPAAARYPPLYFRLISALRCLLNLLFVRATLFEPKAHPLT